MASVVGSYVGEDFRDIAPGEVDDFNLDFKKDIQGDTIAGVTWICELISGVDPAPASHQVAGPVWNLTVATARFGGFVDGCFYKLRAVVQTTDGRTLELFSRLHCRKA